MTVNNNKFEYSVAIRTLGTGGEKYRKEIESLHSQTIKPKNIFVFIAEGYKRPDFQIGIEKYNICSKRIGTSTCGIITGC